MNIIKFNINNSREGILTIGKDTFTCISDQSILNGDVILHIQYAKVVNGDVLCMAVDEVIEQRPSRGEWETSPSTFRRIKFKKETISGSVMKEAGYLKTELVRDGNSQVEKTFLMI